VRFLIAAKLARVRQNYEQAARLFGAAEALREQSGYLLEPLTRAEYEEAAAQVRAQLDPAVFETAWAEGHAMTEEEAINSALGYMHTQLGVME
jgi:hypothetical protein